MPSPHWLRHVCASHSLDRGAPVHVVQQTLGHASLATTNCTQIDSYGDDLHFLRRTILATVGVTAFVEFFVTLYVMSLPGELVYQFVVAALSLMVAMASQKPKYKPVKVFCERVLVLIGLALLAFASRQVYLHWHQLDVREVLLDFALPVWLTVDWVPFLYLFNIHIAYDAAFRLTNREQTSKGSHWRSRLALTCIRGTAWPRATRGALLGVRGILAVPSKSGFGGTCDE